jgi:endogenous inhibitor of DNA gyrase (YacG/DUF329 family)
MTQSNPPAVARGKCPICGRPTDTKYRPFCSRRCADVDLARWLRGAYVIPDQEDGEEGEAEREGPNEPGSGSRH